MKTLEDVMHDAAKAADLYQPLPESFKNPEQAATYYRVLSSGYKTLWMDDAGKVENLKARHEAREKEVAFWSDAYKKMKKEFEFAAKVAATQTEKLELAQHIIKSIGGKETFSEVQIIAQNYLSDQSPEFEED